MQKKFITTSDKTMMNKLLSLGFVLLSRENNIYTFLNQPTKYELSDVEKQKVVYTNMLSI